MNVDLDQGELQLILRNLPTTSSDGEKLSKKLMRHIFPEVDESDIAKKWQQWNSENVAARRHAE